MNKKPILVNSHGGCGSKFMLRQLAPEFKLVGDLIPYHGHLRIPTRDVQRNYEKILFMFCDPREAVISFFMRRENTHERHGFEPTPGLKSLDWAYRHCINIQGDADAFSPDVSLDTYISKGFDCFKLEEFVSNWLFHSLPERILFVRYERIWDNLDYLSDALGLNVEFIDNFPKKIPRRGRVGSLSADLEGGLSKMLDSACNLVADLDDVFLR